MTFILRKGHEFEAAVVEHLRTLADVQIILDADVLYEARRNLPLDPAETSGENEPAHLG